MPLPVAALVGKDKGEPRVPIGVLLHDGPLSEGYGYYDRLGLRKRLDCRSRHGAELDPDEGAVVQANVGKLSANGSDAGCQQERNCRDVLHEVNLPPSMRANSCLN